MALGIITAIDRIRIVFYSSLHNSECHNGLFKYTMLYAALEFGTQLSVNKLLCKPAGRWNRSQIAASPQSNQRENRMASTKCIHWGASRTMTSKPKARQSGPRTKWDGSPNHCKKQSNLTKPSDQLQFTIKNHTQAGLIVNNNTKSTKCQNDCKLQPIIGVCFSTIANSSKTRPAISNRESKNLDHYVCRV